jgi:hypothetical protein
MALRNDERSHASIDDAAGIHAGGEPISGRQRSGQTLSVAMENEDHPDIEGVLRSTFGSGKDNPWDLDEELTSIERYFALFEALNWAVSLDDRLAIDWPFEEIEHEVLVRR